MFNLGITTSPNISTALSDRSVGLLSPAVSDVDLSEYHQDNINGTMVDN